MGVLFFVPFVHKLVIAPAGGRKTTTKVIPDLCHGFRISHPFFKNWSRVASLVTTDLKWENYPMVARLRREQYDQEVLKLNGEHPDTACYEPLILVLEPMREGDIATAIIRAENFAFILEPDPPEGDDKNRFWRNGPRVIILFCIFYVCYTNPDNASIKQVTELLANGDRLWSAVEIARNSKAFSGDMARQAETIHQMGKYFLEHLLSARFDMNSFAGGKFAANAMGKSTFRWGDLKKKKMAVFIGCKLANQKPLKVFHTLMLECLSMELQDERFGGNIPVDILLEEATNFVFNVGEVMAALRGCGGRLSMVVQSWSEVIRVFGAETAKTIWNLCTVKYILGSSHDDDLADKISKILGDEPIYKTRFSTKPNPIDDITTSISEEKQPLMNAHQVMNLRGQLVLIQNVGNILSDPLNYAHVKPWRKWLDDNPVEGGKLSDKPVTKLLYRKRWGDWQSVKVAWYKRKKAKKEKNSQPPLFLKLLWAAFALLYISAAWFAVNMDKVIGVSPHILWEYEALNNRVKPIYISCTYIGLNSRVTRRFPSDCPFFAMLPSDQ